jgi:hypothetical protein
MPDLAARIVAAVAVRQRSLVMWRRIRWLMVASAGIGVALILVSWAHVANTLNPTLNALETNDLQPAFNALVATPTETLANWLDAGLAWQSAQAEDIGLMFTVGIALLSVAAFAGLAQLLNPPTQNRTFN